MEIQFSRAGQPDGGKISNFLLEKVRFIAAVPLSLVASNYLQLATQSCNINVEATANMRGGEEVWECDGEGVAMMRGEGCSNESRRVWQ